MHCPQYGVLRLLEAVPGRKTMHKLMTTDEVADLLSVKPATIRKWVYLEQIPVVLLGRREVQLRIDVLDESSWSWFRRE